MCLLTLTQVSLPSSGKLTDLLQAMCNVCAHNLGTLLLTTLPLGHISRISFPGLIYFCHGFPSPWFRFLFTHTVHASRMPKMLTVARCHRKKFVSSEQHPVTGSRSQCAQASCGVSCPCSLLPHPDFPGDQAPR